jgi:Protein of unknown function (DUF3551)
MRHLALVKLASLAMLSIGTMAAAAPAHAQAYDPNYPVCMQVYGPLSRTECRYFSIPQCQASASGRSARCEINPFFANASREPIEAPIPRHHRRHRHAD